MNNYTRICARVDLDAIEYNMEMMKKNIKEGVQMISVIKTDGYGHGALQIARMLEGKEYLWGYAGIQKRWQKRSLNWQEAWENRHISISSWIQACPGWDF